MRGLDLAAVRAAKGVVAVLTAADIPGKNDIAPAFADEPLFADKEILFHNQAIFAVVARTRDEARRAARLAKIDIAEAKPAITVEDALETGARVLPDYEFGRGDAAAALERAPHRLEGVLRIGGQEHFYLEGQAAFAIPGEAREMTGPFLDAGPDRSPAYRRAHPRHSRRVRDGRDAAHGRRLRRQGKPGLRLGGDRRAGRAIVTGKPCKVRLDRDDDFALTGKRHDFRADWRVGYDDKGVVSAYDVMLNARCGCSADLSLGVVDRAMFHAANAYWLPDVKIASKRLKTNTVSNTAFRGFGGPQGMVGDRARDGRDRP